MNLEKLYPLWFILCTAAGASIGHFTGYGVLKGAVDGVFISWTPLFLLVLLLAFMSVWRPTLPSCRCGKSGRNAYRLAGVVSEAPRRVRFQCAACQRIYESSAGRFDEATGDGRLEPYMRHSKWGRWKRCAAGALPVEGSP